VQLGFVIDQSRCIGCHACTVACKAENNVPLGRFRTWVKYTETGAFPQVRRHFTVLRCNQCTDAPCVTICPVRALEKRADGIVDVDPAACIGCKACMQGCPYDALYINDGTGTAQKCHFCAHRVEQGLAPACAIVCPTEAIIPGDFHDPDSRVSRMRREEPLTARKVEAGTGPNVFYKAADASGTDPLRTNAGGGFLWANQPATLQFEAQVWEAMDARARATDGGVDGADGGDRANARTVYDVGRPLLWGSRVTAYLFAKSLAAGVFLAAVPALLTGGLGTRVAWIPLMALAFLGITAVLLVGDLKRPERFWFILQRPNWSSWLARGTVVLMAYGALLLAWLLWAFASPGPANVAAIGVTGVAAALAAAYTAWLFQQARGRVLWMRQGLAMHLVAQAVVAGGAFLLLAHSVLQLGPVEHEMVRRVLVVSLFVHGALTLADHTLAPRRREREYLRVTRLVTRGPFASAHWTWGVGVGIAFPLLVLLVPGATTLHVAASAAMLVGLYVEEDVFVRAGQAQPIS
jgi:Fe-S-cluster-containing dehydrogenase component/formate-dependent nitrite reductase membrane component NrfD